MRILLSRTDSIGDVILSIPMAGWLKWAYPEATIHFLGRNYTKDILACSEHIDHVHVKDDWQGMSPDKRNVFIRGLELDAVVHVFPDEEVGTWMKQAAVPKRIGTAKRLHHWRTCNRRPWLSRRHSKLHESQLNLQLLVPLGYQPDLPLSRIAELYGFSQIPALEPKTKECLKEGHFHLILHPKSAGSAREWGLERFGELIRILPADVQVILTGTASEGASFRGVLHNMGRSVTDTSGQLSLAQLIALIAASDGLIAASTGPLHIAAASGVHALGLFIAKPPMHPGRWAPIGPLAETLVHDSADLSLDSMERIEPSRVADRVRSWLAGR